MDAVVKPLPGATGKQSLTSAPTRAPTPTLAPRPSREEAEQAVRTLISWAGDNPGREGLLETPARVTAAFREFFSGYDEDPHEILSRTFDDVGGYDGIVMIRDIAIASHCEHHMAPIIGKAHIAYQPIHNVVGLSKLARVVELYARRLQTQETMTAQIADAINEVLQPAGVAVMIDALHQCMTTRGVHKSDAATVTFQRRGVFRDDPRMEQRFMDMIHG